MIVQWGAESSYYDISWDDIKYTPTTNVSFPISFPSKCYTVIPAIEMNPEKLAGATIGYVTTKAPSKFSFKWDEWNVKAIQSVKVGYIAIGV